VGQGPYQPVIIPGLDDRSPLIRRGISVVRVFPFHLSDVEQL
jgi:hypothetical protein